jgi:drug/metabolite transporter (DMT)-like permease
VTDRAAPIGVALAAIGAVSYGVTVVVGEDLADAGFGPATSLGVRFAVAGLLLALILRARGRRVLAPRRDVLAGLALGAVYALEATFFFSSLERMTAAATALIVYVYPALVTVIELVRGKERAHRSTFVALALSTLGSAIVVVGAGHVDVTAAGVGFALASAATYAAYLLVGREVARSLDPMFVAAWVAIGASLTNLAKGAVARQLVDPSGRSAEILLYGLSTAIAFTLTFAAMQRIGAARVAMVMTLEAVSSVIMAAIFLHESITFVQGIGGVAVLAAALVIAGSQQHVAMAEAGASAAGP